MRQSSDTLHHFDVSKIDESVFTARFVGCVILTDDNHLLLQQRCSSWDYLPGRLTTFGGRIEGEETPLQTLVRELNEELEAVVLEKDVVALGAVTEALTQHTQLVYHFFWHDQQGTIGDCHEGRAKYYNTITEALSHPKLMDDVRWLLAECQRRGFLNLCGEGNSMI